MFGSGSPRGDLTQRSPHTSIIHASKHAEQLSPGSGHYSHYSHYDTLQSLNGGNYEGETLQQADVLDLMPDLMVGGFYKSLQLDFCSLFEPPI